ncbi:hypothetical protein EG327_004511 [Venturia inaequalis]|uniref:Uncharacterized protein n=1 Tax=Venturia inaequalis TaxID=5025 RepID=A0A8H3U308_VENIN|nr:hypothetical protein EG327_004511 [Venturia inaequalis]
MKLAAASAFLSTFSTLELHYKLGRIYIVPDALSRLQRSDEEKDYIDNLEEILQPGVFHVLLVEMSEDFKDRIRRGYTLDPRWSKVHEWLKVNKPDDLEAILTPRVETMPMLEQTTSIPTLDLPTVIPSPDPSTAIPIPEPTTDIPNLEPTTASDKP